MVVIEIEGGAGDADALKPVERPRPEPASGEVLIRVVAAGINRPDILQRRGLYPAPPGASDIPGLEVAGEIAAVGKDVSRWNIGDRVCALLGGGGYAEYAAVDARHVLPIPATLDFVQATALPETVFTVWANVFEHGGLKAGETLLVHGATSGIGVAAIQMGKASGARVITTSRGPQKAAAAKTLGADVAIDALAGEFGESVRAAGGADVILDMVGAAYAASNLAALNSKGRWVVIAVQGGARAEIDLMQVMRKQAVLTGSTLRGRPADETARLAAAVEARVWPWIEGGAVRAVVDATYPLAQAAEAHRRLESGGHIGKVVLTV